VGCPTGLFSWADTLDTKIKTQKMGKNILCAKLNNFSGHEKSLSRKKKTFWAEVLDKFSKTTILGRSSGQKRKKSKIDSQQKR
jgi:hypothetical protein